MTRLNARMARITGQPQREFEVSVAKDDERSRWFRSLLRTLTGDRKKR